jgi:insulysin
LQEFAYDAELAGLVFNCGPHRLGLMITLDGYNDKLPVLARRVLETVRNLQVSEDRLAVFKEKVFTSCYISSMGVGSLWLIRSNVTGKISSWTRVTVYRIIIRNTSSLMTLGLSLKSCRRSPVSRYGFLTKTDLTLIMTGVTRDDLQRHISNLLARLNIEMLVTGNMHKDVRTFSG